MALTLDREWMPCRRPRFAVKADRPQCEPAVNWRRSIGSPHLVRTPWTHCGTNVLLGWRSHQGDRLPQYADRLILMGVWRDPSQPRIEETGALGNCIRSLKSDSVAYAAEGTVCSLDTGPLMGVHLFFKWTRVRYGRE